MKIMTDLARIILVQAVQFMHPTDATKSENGVDLTVASV